MKWFKKFHALCSDLVTSYNKYDLRATLLNKIETYKNLIMITC